MPDKADTLRKFGEHLKQLRKKQGLTLLEIEVLTGISEGSLSKMENGKKNPALTTLVKLAKGLGVPVSKLVVVFDKEIK
jgi:transcriptional regulator with XRE-family HTH domain